MVKLPKHILLGNEYVFEDEFAGVGTAHAEFVEFAGTGETFGCAVHYESCDALGAFIWFCLCVDNYMVCIGALKYSTQQCRSVGHVQVWKLTLVIHILVPLSKYPSSTAFAVVFMLTTSEPAECSDIASAPIFFPDIKPGRNLSF